MSDKINEDNGLSRLLTLAGIKPTLIIMPTNSVEATDEEATDEEAEAEMQHSDARVSDQLIYKWNHFKKILHPILLEYYQDLLDKNFPISENILQRDVNNLLSGNAKNYLGIT